MQDVQGKEPWMKVMQGIRRKTLVLCVESHDQLQKGILSDWNRNARRTESPVP